MIKLRSLTGQARRAPLATDQIDSVESPPFRVEAEDCDPEIVSPVDRLREHAVANEHQPPAPIRRSNQCSSFHSLQPKIPSLVLNPRQVTSTVEVTRLNCRARGHNGVCRAKVNHPFATQCDCFIVRSAPGPRLRKLPFHGSSLPETAVPATFGSSPEDGMSELARSLTPPPSSRRKASIGDRS